MKPNGRSDGDSTCGIQSRPGNAPGSDAKKRLGIKGGDVVILEDRGSEIVLKPGVVLELDLYDDDQIAQWDAQDRLEDDERQRIVAAVAARPK